MYALSRSVIRDVRGRARVRTCVTRSICRSCILRYIRYVHHLHLLLFISLFIPLLPGFFNFDHAPSSLSELSPCFPAVSARFPARFLVTLSCLSLLLSSSLSLSFSCYLGSDSICRTMLLTMWLHAGDPCSLGAMPELRRRVSLQSTMLLGTQKRRRLPPRIRTYSGRFTHHRCI